MNEQDYLIAWGTYAIARLGLMLMFWLMISWMQCWLCEPLRLIVLVLLFMSTPAGPQDDLYTPAITITMLGVVSKVGNNAWRMVPGLALMVLLGFGLYPSIAAIRWPLGRTWKSRRHPPRDAENEPTLRQMMQPELMPDINIRTDEHGDRRMRIKPRL